MRLGEEIGRLSRATQRLFGRRLPLSTELSLLELRALKVIDREGIATQSELGERLLADAPAISRLVDRLEEGGLLKRCAGADRRSVRLAVTAAGRREIKALDEAHEWVEAQALRHLSAAELALFKELSQRLSHGFCRALDDAQRPAK